MKCPQSMSGSKSLCRTLKFLGHSVLVDELFTLGGLGEAGD